MYVPKGASEDPVLVPTRSLPRVLAGQAAESEEGLVIAGAVSKALQQFVVTHSECAEATGTIWLFVPSALRVNTPGSLSLSLVRFTCAFTPLSGMFSDTSTTSFPPLADDTVPLAGSTGAGSSRSLHDLAEEQEESPSEEDYDEEVLMEAPELVRSQDICASGLTIPASLSCHLCPTFCSSLPWFFRVLIFVRCYR